MDSLEETPRIIHLAEVDSTNNYLRSLLRNERLPEGSVVVTDDQTKGRGQTGNSWESAPGMNLTFSIVLYPNFIRINQQFLISQIAALSVKETLERYTDQVLVKWPNDIYRKDGKICGMLIENDLKGHEIHLSVIGIGINLNQERFISNAPNPVSLYQITGETYSRKETLDIFLSTFFRYYLLLLQEKEEEIRRAYRQALYRGEGYFTYRDQTGTFEAAVYDIEPMGYLLLQLKNGEIRRYAFKEVSFV